MRLIYSCSELGLGHASRTIALGKKLEQRGHEIFFFTGGKAYELIKKEFRNVYSITPIAWYENSSGIIIAASLINILFPLPVYNVENNRFQIKSSNAMETIHRYYDLRKSFGEIRPNAVIADGDIIALRLAQRWKVPHAYITNLIRPSYGFSSLLSPGERMTEHYVKSCTKIIIPDNVMPYTVCEYNIGNLKDVGVVDKTELVGSFFDTTSTAVSEKHIFAPVSGPFGTRVKLLKMLLPAFEELGLEGIISLGIPGEQKVVNRGKCKVYSWLPESERREAMRNASIVIFSGGHITCFETIKYAKPSICIPTQPEQLANAAKLQDLGCSIVAENKNELLRAIREIRMNYKKYKQRIETLNCASNMTNGLKRAVEIVEDLRPR